MFFGRSAVMAKALGTSAEEENRLGLHKLAQVRLFSPIRSDCLTVEPQRIKGQVGLFFTDTEPQEVVEWFADFQQPDFARAGNVASRTVILPAGPVMQHYSDPPEPFPHNEEPQLRKLGLRTTMNRGVPTLSTPHKLCEEGQTLSAEQAQLLKLVGHKMVVFRVRLIARWSAASGEVEQIESEEIPPGNFQADDDGDDEDAVNE